ncbi:MAG: hypothetical protein QM820_40885 [Minicystis sp.]
MTGPLHAERDEQKAIAVTTVVASLGAGQEDCRRHRARGVERSRHERAQGAAEGLVRRSAGVDDVRAGEGLGDVEEASAIVPEIRLGVVFRR